MLIAHITITIFGLVFATVVYFKPSLVLIGWSVFLSIATMLSGAYLVLFASGHLVHVCISGVIYSCIAAFGIVSGANKLRTAAIKNHL